MKKETLERLVYNKYFVLFTWLLIFAFIFAYNYCRLDIRKLVKVCFFLRATGYLCPGCGGTRALHHLLKGHIIKSIRLNFIPSLIGIYFILFFIEHSINILIGSNLQFLRPRRWMLWFIGVLIILFGIIRNTI